MKGVRNVPVRVARSDRARSFPVPLIHCFTKEMRRRTMQPTRTNARSAAIQRAPRISRGLSVPYAQTMIDLEPQQVGARAELCREMGSDYEQLPDWIRFESGRRILDEISEMRAIFGWTVPADELLAKRQTFFRAACESSPLALLPCVEEVVRKLRHQGLVLAVTSSAVGPEIDV